MRLLNKQIVPVCSSTGKLFYTIALTGIVFLTLNGCTINNDIRLRNKTTATMVADYYTDDESWLDSLDDDDEDDIDEKDEEDNGGHRLILQHGEGEDIAASDTRSVYMMVMGIVLKRSSSDDISIYNEDVQKKALELYEAEMSRVESDETSEPSAEYNPILK